MAKTKHYTGWAIVYLILSIAMLCFSNQVGPLLEIPPLALRIASPVIALVCVARIALHYLPDTSKKRLFFIGLFLFAIFLIMMIFIDVITVSNTLWQYSVILYFVLSISAFIIQNIQQKGALKIVNDKQFFTSLIIWFISSVFIFFASFNLFEYTPEYKGVLGIISAYYMLVITAIYIGVCIVKYSLLYRVAYIAVILCAALFCLIYFELLSDVYVLPVIAVLCTMVVVAIPLLCYICVTDYPRLDGTVAVISIMVIIKGISICMGSGVLQRCAELLNL